MKVFIVTYDFISVSVAVLKEEFISMPKAARVAAGDTAVLDCDPPKGTPRPTIVWRKDGVDIDLDHNSNRY